MNFLTSLGPTIIVLGVLIVIHEFGHFLACRLSGVKVEKFSIGFGPEIFHWQGKETRYAVSLFPLGGFVKPAGETFGELGASGAKKGDYLAASLLSRIFIVVAGVLMNYFLAYVLFVFMFVVGKPIPGTTVGEFVADFPAISSGMQVGDKILSVNGKPVGDWAELTVAFDQAADGPMVLDVDRSGTRLPVTLVPKVMEIKDLFGEVFKVKRLGIKPDPEDNMIRKLPLDKAVVEAGNTVVFLTVTTHKAIFYLLQGKLSMKTLSGPVGIITMTGQAAKLGLPYLLQLTANLSVSLAVINLFPIPALDGGHLLFLLVEGIRRKPVSLQVQEKATQIGFALLLALMVFIIYNDLVNYEYLDKLKHFLQKMPFVTDGRS